MTDLLDTCEYCAAESETSFMRSCIECSARALALGPWFFESLQEKNKTLRYERALTAVFGDEAEAGHERVKAWAKRFQRKRKK